MARPVLFPKHMYFYPIGNTSAICLTRDLAPEEPADILLLGSGDPRNVLYTIFSSSVAIPRKLDFTCCDVNAAVLARNVLLLTMVADGQDIPKTWNIFFHMYLDKASLSLLFKQCRILIDISETVQTWQRSKYATFLKMCSSHTLAELRRHWSLYVETEEFTPERMEQFRNRFQAGTKLALDKAGTNYNASASAGPLHRQAMRVASKHFQHFWKTGITSVDPKDVAAATFVNPTFVYSASREVFSVHYGTDPLHPFHLASAFSRSPTTATITDVVNTVKAQFSSWCDAFHASITSESSIIPVIRIFAGDALAFCLALHHCASTRSTETHFYVAPWIASTINLDGGGYADAQAPTTFNVIDTSNLIDHVGLMNLLIATIPVLSRSPSSAINTESMLLSDEGSTSKSADGECADTGVISLLLGVAPNPDASRFTTRSDTYEVPTRIVVSETPQFHEHITWKISALGDTIALQHVADLRRPPSFNASQLTRFLFDVYLKMFANEDLQTMIRNENSKAMQGRALECYIRESFVMFVKLVKSRVDTDWDRVMAQFFNLVETDKAVLRRNNYQELCCQLRLHGVYSHSLCLVPVRKNGRFRDWDSVPPLVRVTLTIPREKIEVLERMENLGTPVLRCDLRGSNWYNTFSSIQVAFGRVTSTGSKKRPEVIFEEDPASWSGTSALIASFWMPAWILTTEPDATHISLSVRSSSMASIRLMAELGQYLDVFATKLMDERYVHITPEHQSPSRSEGYAVTASPHPQEARQIGKHSPIQVVLDDECLKVATLGIKLDIEEPQAKSTFSSGAQLKVEQTSPCVMTVSFAEFEQQLAFPFPVIGSRSKLRIARKSLYIEVIVPISGPSLPDGFSLDPFPVIVGQQGISLGNIHRVNLECLPILNVVKRDWFGFHMGITMSDRERTLNDRGVQTDTLLNLKDSLRTIFISVTGVSVTKYRIFSLVESGGPDTLIFIMNLRLDLPSHTIVADGYVLPLTEDIILTFRGLLATIETKMLHIRMFGDEPKAWKQILPAFTERCRRWKHKDSCEYILKGSVPLSVKSNENPLCSCGRGQDTEAFLQVKEWRKLAPYVTRVALGPVFAVPCLESAEGKVGSGPRKSSSAATDSQLPEEKCAACGGTGKPKLLVCSKCKKVMYCSVACQKEDWRASHKSRCKSSTA